jgi:hypothetical protein
MNTQEKKDAIRTHVEDMLKQSHEAMIKKIDRILNCGAVDVDSWEPDAAPIILPMCIVVALLETEARQYDGRGTSFERRVAKEVRNIRHFI